MVLLAHLLALATTGTMEDEGTRSLTLFRIQPSACRWFEVPTRCRKHPACVLLLNDPEANHHTSLKTPPLL